MEIQKGMYIRTEDGYIGKCIDIDSDNFMFFDKPVYKNFSDTFDSCYLSNIDIKKASFNIIDLIEVGDYVNDERVYYAYCSSEGSTGLFIEEAGIRVWLEKDSQIKDIVTKEQFDSMKYVVERDTNE